MLALYISEALDCDKSLVFSVDNPVPIPAPEMVFGDSYVTKLFIVDGQGGYSTVSGQAGATVKVGIGDLSSDDPVWLNTTWSRITNGWQGTISSNIQAIYDLFNGQTFINASLRVQIINVSGSKRTYALLPFKLWRLGISGSALPTPPEDSQDGEFDIPEGADAVTVTGLNLSAIPRRVYCMVRKPAGGFNLWPTLVDGTVTTDGFTVNLNGETDSADYKLDFIFIF